MKKNSEITEDDLKDGEKEIQKITDNCIKDIEAVADAKEKEIMEIWLRLTGRRSKKQKKRLRRLRQPL